MASWLGVHRIQIDLTRRARAARNERGGAAMDMVIGTGWAHAATLGSARNHQHHH